MKSLAVIRGEHPNDHVARFLAGHARTVGYEVEANPLPGNEAHALVLFSGSSGDLRRAARRLRDEFVELIQSQFRP